MKLRPATFARASFCLKSGPHRPAGKGESLPEWLHRYPTGAPWGASPREAAASELYDSSGLEPRKPTGVGVLASDHTPRGYLYFRPRPHGGRCASASALGRRPAAEAPLRSGKPSPPMAEWHPFPMIRLARPMLAADRSARLPPWSLEVLAPVAEPPPRSLELPALVGNGRPPHLEFGSGASIPAGLPRRR